MLTRRIGWVPPEQPGSAAHGPVIRLVDSLVYAKNLPVEMQAWNGPPRLDPEFSAWLLPPGAPAQPWLKELSGPVTIAAPFFTPGARRSSLLVWSYEETSRTRMGRGTPAEGWVETTFLSKAGIEATVRHGRDAARDRDSVPVWAYVGWGDAEDQAVQLAQKAMLSADPTSEFRIVSLERLTKDSLDRAFPSGSVVLCSARTALPLARLMETQGWVAWSDGGFCVAQPAADFGAGMALGLLLDRLGFLQESQALERAVREAAKGGTEGWLERAVTALKEGGAQA